MSAGGTLRRAGGSELDRDRRVRFRFNGKAYEGFAGDSLASGLLANGVRVVGRSFKFHRPRGVFTCGFEEPNALVQINSGPRAVLSERSTIIELYDGLEALSPAGWPNLRFDVGRLLDFAAPLWAAGFYNKTFIWPRWSTYEKPIRHMAGFGRAPVGRDPDRYDWRNLYCDVLVIGGGVAGLQAAMAAAEAGSRVVVTDCGQRLGGRALWDGSQVDRMPADIWASQAAGRLAAMANVQVLTRTMATGVYGRNVVALSERAPLEDVQRGAVRERFIIVRAGHVIVAAGAIEQSLIFCNNDRPGVLLAGAAHEYLRRYAVTVGDRVVIATNNDSAYGLAGDLKEAGVEVVALADTRHEIPQACLHALRSCSIPLLTGSIPVDTTGFGALSSVSIGKLSNDSRTIESVRRFTCDTLAVSGGWNPTLHLFSQAGGQVTYSERSRALQPATREEAVTVTESVAQAPVGIRVSPVGNTLRQWVDLRHDVTVADLELAVRENYRAIEHVKRYTTVGMATDQGKTSNLAAIEIVAHLQGVEPSQIGHTTFRPPFTPVTLGAIAGRAIGRRFIPARYLPMHDWHVANGAVIEDYSEWKRPAVYLHTGELRDQAIAREARTVRTAAGLLDGSSLGKIEVHGPDAIEFLDRFYLNNLETLKPGRVRYGLMLRESGVLFDDGTIVMLAPDRLLITTTSSNASRVFSWLDEWHQCEWPGLRVALTPVTEQWAVISLAGPRSRDILAGLECDIDLSPAAFPHLTLREGRLLGYPTRIFRVSFTGELSYEINVPAGAGPRIWSAIYEAGRPHGIQPFGLDAQSLLRLEKGFLHIGTDTDGTTVPADVGWGEVAARKRADFVGKRSLLLPENSRTDRFQLVGLKSEVEMIVGSHLRLPRSQESTDGWITSAGRAVLAGEPIALALLRGGRERVGSELTVHNGRHVSRAIVVKPPFLDAAGTRMNG